VCEPARQDHDVGALQIGFFVPDVLGLLANDVARGVVSVFVAVAAGKDNDTEFECAQGLINFDAIAFNHRIGKELVGDFGREGFRLRLLGRIELGLESLPCRTSPTAP
jgi:hypothetical protein